MMRLAALALFIGLTAFAALAQQADLLGTWDVERLIDSAAEPVIEGSLSALLPDNPYTLAPIALRLGGSGEAVVTLFAARQDGYELVHVPSAYRVEDGRLAISLGGVDTHWGVEQQGDVLILTAEDGSSLALRRTRGA